MKSMKERRRRAPFTILTSFVFFISFVIVVPPLRAQSFDPAYRFRVISTAHFEIYFHQGEEALAGRLAGITEQTWERLRDSLGGRMPGRTHVVLVDQTDVANGWATPLPRDTVVLFAAWPAGFESLETDDWLELVFTHEFAHILHLDRSEGWARVARRVLGRSPLAFPNLLLPTWQIEGLATYEESAITREGRMHAGDFRAIVDEAARGQVLLPLDRANGGLTRWPGGQAPYAYGLRFHAFLAERYGPDTLQALADQTARSVPYLGSLAFKRVYGKSLGELWAEFEASVAAAAPEAARVEGTRLTHHDYVVLGPRFVPSACAGCPPDIYYSVRNADELPSLYRVAATSTSSPERVVTRYLGSTLAVGRDRLYFDQQEARRNAGLYSDLYSLEVSSGRVRRLTHDARLIDPDLSPDGTTIAAVQVAPGRRDLVLVTLGSIDSVTAIRPIATEAGTQFNVPRWSPDGRTIVVERHRTGHLPEIVLVDAASHAIAIVAGRADTRWTTPTWRPDGRAIVAAAAIGDAPFDLFEIEIATRRQRRVTRTTGGATWPEFAPDGRSLVYVGYSASGFDLYRMDYQPLDAENPGTPSPQNLGTLEPQNLRTLEPQNPRTYSPWPTVLPTSWLPVVSSSGDRTAIGAATAGTDILNYHAFAASFTRWMDAEPGAPRLDWDVTYAYRRWRPMIVSTVSRETTFTREGTTSVVPGELWRQSTKVAVGVALPINSAQTSHLFIASLQRGKARLGTIRGERTAERAAFRSAWAFNSANVFGNSISPEGGILTGVTAELVRRALGSSADATTITGDARVYLPGLAPHHVVAVRAVGGSTRGNPLLGRMFLLGGPGPDLSTIDFDTDAVTLLRGFPSDSFRGSHVALVNADYRFPLWRIERGFGTWPLFAHTLHGAVFVDAGDTWIGAFKRSNLKRSYGAELAADLVVGYAARVTVAFGAAHGHDGSGRSADRTTWYARAGYAF